MFESIIDGAKEKFGIGGDKAGGLLAAVLGLIADPASGGFGGFIDKFKNAGMGDLVSSWIGTGDSQPMTSEQVTAALGDKTISSVAKTAGIDGSTAATAMAGMIPQVVDSLTPDGNMPDESGLLDKISGFMSDWGGAIGGAVVGGIGAAAAMAGGAADKVGDAAGATIGKGKEVLSGGIDAAGDAAGATYDKGKEILSGGVGAAGDVAGAARDKVSGAIGSVGNALDIDSGGGSFLKWLIPLLLLIGVIALGWMFLGRGTTPATNSNANTSRSNTNTTNTASTVNANANTGDAVRKLSEVALPDGTKLQAYPGGIEDQLVKFIQSDEFKNATPELLKEKWFNFDDLNFKFGTTELAPESKRQLDNVTAILKAFPAVKIKIGGYTDKKGDDAGNLKLSDTRAKAVQAALQKEGVGAQVPEAEGYGEKMATVDENASDDARKVDRKTSIRLIK